MLPLPFSGRVAFTNHVKFIRLCSEVNSINLSYIRKRRAKKKREANSPTVVVPAVSGWIRICQKYSPLYIYKVLEGFRFPRKKKKVEDARVTYSSTRGHHSHANQAKLVLKHLSILRTRNDHDHIVFFGTYIRNLGVLNFLGKKK